MDWGPTSANPEPPEPDDEAEYEIGSLIADKYRVVRAIGSGSSGSVYLCQHVGLDKLVALKVLHREMEQNAGFVERFKREAQAASRLEHPNSVRVLDFGQDRHDGALYIVMEYIEGRDLLRALEEDGPFSAERAVHVMSQILDALSVAHSLGIVHRDLKPENVVIRTVSSAVGSHAAFHETVTVCDFGIAQLSPIRLSGISESESVSISDAGVVVGTPAYMSPEQARAEPQDARSDVYSAGVVLYQLLTLHVPFTAETPLAVAVKHCSEIPPRPSLFGAVSPALEDVCLKALSKTPEARYQTAAEMRAALGRALHATPPPRNRRTPQTLWSPLRVHALATRPVEPPTGLGPPSLLPIERSTSPDELRPHSRRRWSVPVLGFGLAVLAIGGLPLALRTWAASPQQRPRAASRSVTQPSAAVVVARTAPIDYADPAPPSVAVPSSNSDTQAAPAESSTAPTASAPSAVPAALAKRVALATATNPRSSAHTSRVPSTPVLVATRAPLTAAEQSVQPLPSAGPDAPVDESTVARDALVAQPLQTTPSVALPQTPPAAAVMSLGATAPNPVPVPATASVTIGPIAARAAVSKASVRGALNLQAITSCYRDGLRMGDAPATQVVGQVEFTTNIAGGISSAAVTAPMLTQSLRHCIEQVVRRGRVREVDTGAAQASVTLVFQPR